MWIDVTCHGVFSLLYQPISKTDQKVGEDMKKVGIFLLAILLLFTGSLIYANQRSLDVTFDLIDHVGSSEILKPIRAEFSYGISRHIRMLMQMMLKVPYNIVMGMRRRICQKM